MPDWIPIRCDLADDPTVLRIAAQLGVIPCAVAGALTTIWGWFTHQTETGMISAPCRCHETARDSVTVERDTPVTLLSRSCVSGQCARVTLVRFLDDRVRIPGICEAMFSAGWLVVEADEIGIPKWDRYLSQGAKARELTNERQRKKRERDAKKNRGQQPVNQVSRSSVTPMSRSSVTTGQDRTGQISDSACAESCDTPNEPTTKRATTTPRKPRPPDPIWDAVAAIWFAGKVIPGQATRVGRIVRDLKALEATPADIADRHARQRDEWGDNGATPESLVKHWHQFGPDRKPPNGRHEEPSPARIQAEPGKYDHIRPINAKGKT